MARTMTDSLATYRTPLYADFLLAHSTVAGFYSWRNTVSGSWFIQVSNRNQQSTFLLELKWFKSWEKSTELCYPISIAFKLLLHCG